MWGKQQTFQVQGLGIETEGARSAIDVLTLALWTFAGVTMLAGVVAIGIVLTRDIAHVAVDQSTLRALGTSRGQRGAAIIARALVIAVGGALLAGTGAIVASPRFPVGIARRADPDVGVHADGLALGIGIALVAAVVLTVAFLAAWRVTRAPSADRNARFRRRTSPVVERAARAGMPPAATTGLRMALQSDRGDAAVPIRSAYAGAVLAVAGITAAARVRGEPRPSPRDPAPLGLGMGPEGRSSDRCESEREVRRPQRPRAREHALESRPWRLCAIRTSRSTDARSRGGASDHCTGRSIPKSSRARAPHGR